MSNCKICESPLHEDTSVCLVCGTPLKHKLPSRVSLGRLEKSHTAVLSEIGLEEAKGIDVSVAKRLLEKSEEAKVGGDVSLAMETTKAAKRALEISRKKEKLQANLTESEAKIEDAKVAGINTLALEKTLSDAREALDKGDLSRTDTLLRRANLKKQQARTRRHAEKLIESARKKVSYCRERGADDSEAQDELKKAEEAFRISVFTDVKRRCIRAQEKADQARRFARAESFLTAARGAAQEASKQGADVTEARRHLQKARSALRQGVYSDVQKFSREAKQAVREAKRRASVDRILKQVEKDVRKEERKKSDLSGVLPLMEDAKKAIEEGEYSKAKSILKDARNGIKELVSLRRMSNSIESLKLDVEDLKEIGADSSELEALLIDAESAFDAKRPDEVQRIIVQARKASEFAREAKQRLAVANAVERILERVGAGRLDSSRVQHLLKQVEDAALLGQTLDIERMVEEELQLPDQERLRRAMVRLQGIRDLLVELKRSDVDISGADELIAKVRARLDEGRFDDAENLIGQLEGLTQELKASMESSVRDLLDKSRNAVENSENKGISLPEAHRLIEKAEESFKQGKIYQALEFARIAHLQAENALEAKEKKLSAEELAKLKKRTELAGEIHRGLWAFHQKIEELAKADIDVHMAREGINTVLEALDRGDIEEAQSRFRTTEKLVNLLWQDLEVKAETTLERAKTELNSAKKDDVHLPALDETISHSEKALDEGKLGEVLLMAAGLERTVAAARAAQEKERAREMVERGKRASKTFSRVKALIHELKQANVDIAESENVLAKAETALEEKEYEEVETLLQDLEKTANELKAQLLVAVKTILKRANERLALAKERNIDTSQIEKELDTAKQALDSGRLDKAIEFASMAEKKVDEAIKLWEQKQTELRMKEEELAKTIINNFRNVMQDLSRADIDVMGSMEAMEKAETALKEGRYSDVEKELAEAISLAQTLQEGLKEAALDLLKKSRTNLDNAKKGDLEVGRGEKVLLNAEEALDQGRYVETIEYTKVINDIVETAKRHKGIKAIEAEIKALRNEIERAQTLGIDMRVSSEMLKQAQEDIALGRFDNLPEISKRIAETVDSAQQVYIVARLKTMTNAIQECKEIGIQTNAAESIYKKAEEAIKNRDLPTLDSLSKQVDVLMESARRSAEADQVEKDIRSFEDMLNQASRVGVEVGDLRPIIHQAREALLSKDFAKAESLVTEGKAKVRERRRQQFTDRYETRMKTISTMIDNAKKFGANVAEAERILIEASRALEKHDLNLADILVKQAEVSAGIQIQNFIKNRYPNLIVKLPEEGLQSDVWNNYIVEISNKGKLSAKNVNLKLEGDVEIKGLEPIQELGVNETKKLEFGVKPKSHGYVPLNVEILYQRFFDENKYELKDLKTLKVEQPGTYLVEDIFLVHSDGRLITHQTRKYRETIDEDIFSGMLTVVQDFVKDSFRERTKVSLKRLEFGQSKIILERSKNVYLACVIIGEESGLLPLYMAEVLREIENKYGEILESWSGMMQELEGIDQLVTKLIFVTDKSEASLGTLKETALSETLDILNSAALLDEDAVEVKKLIDDASDQLQVDSEFAFKSIENARREAQAAIERYKGKMKEIRDATHRYVEEMRELGEDVSQAELLIKEADNAYEIGKYEKLKEIYTKMRDGVEKARDAQFVKRIEKDLTELIQDIQLAKAEGADTAMAESFLSRIQDALEEKNYKLVDDYFKRARENLDTERKETFLKKSRETLDKLTSMVIEAKELGVSVEEAESLLKKAASALEHERTEEIEGLLEAARSSATQQIQGHLKDRYPRLFLKMPTSGLQEGMWNSYLITLNNKGNWPAKSVEFRAYGNMDIGGPRTLSIIGPNEKKTLEIGIKPRSSGTIPLDIQLFYQRPLDESKYELTESKEVKIESKGTYIVDDIVLVHKDGREIISQSRYFKEEPSDDKKIRINTAVRNFIRDTYDDRGEVGLKRMGFEKNTILVEQGPGVYLAVSISGEEPKLLPLYMLEILSTLEQSYEKKLGGWDGKISSLEGIHEKIRTLFYVTEKSGADPGPLNTCVVSATKRLIARGILKGEGGMDFIEAARSKIESENFNSAVEILVQIKEAVERPIEELTAEVKAAVLATKETIGLELTDEEVAQYVEILQQVLQTIIRAKQKAGIESYWPVKRIAIRPTNNLAMDAITSFRKIIVNQSLTKELDIVPLNETWRGMNIRVQVDTEALNRSYKLWAKKIEILLKSQDAWKIKSGLDKGEYAVGIEGQKVKIDKEMVWFEESLPDTVVEVTSDVAIIFIDTEMTDEILSEGYAKEIVRIIRDIRKEMKLTDEKGIQLQMMASMGLYKMLKNWREYISSQTNSADFRFIEEPPTEGYIVEATLGEEAFSISVKSVEA